MSQRVLVYAKHVRNYTTKMVSDIFCVPVLFEVNVVDGCARVFHSIPVPQVGCVVTVVLFPFGKEGSNL
jgi:hypothetical protein